MSSDSGQIEQPDSQEEVDLARWCYACGDFNPIGLHLEFEMEPNGAAVAKFVALPEHQGYPGFVHGGVVTTLLDEAMGWATYGVGIYALTARMESRFREPIPVGEQLLVTGHIQRDRGRSLNVVAELRDAQDKLLAEANAVLFRASGEQAELIRSAALARKAKG